MTAKVDEYDFDNQSEMTLKEKQSNLINQVIQRKPSTQTQGSTESKIVDGIFSKNSPEEEDKNGSCNFEEISSKEVQEVSDEHHTQNQEHSQSASELHAETSESLNIEQDAMNDEESQDEENYMSNDTSENLSETLIGKKRKNSQRDTNDINEEITEPASKHGKIGEYGHRKGCAGQKFTKILKQGNQIAKWLGAVCLVQTNFCRTYNKAALSFECKNSHKFFLNIDQISDTYAQMINFIDAGHQEVTKEILEQINWCGKCAKLYEKVGNICAKQKLHLLDGLHKEHMIVKCQQRGHIFSLTYKKAYDRLYYPRAHPKRLQIMQCPHCEREIKEEEKERRRQEEWDAGAPERQRQAEEIAEARKRNWTQMTQSTKQTVNKPKKTNYPKQKQKQYSSEYLQMLEDQINEKARDQAALYVANDLESDFNKVFLVYKFNETPQDIIVEGMLGLGSHEVMHQYYKKLARMLHPDKNTHELANEAFQKVSQAYQDVGPILKKQDALKAAKQAMPAQAQPQSAYQAYFNAYFSKAKVY